MTENYYPISYLNDFIFCPLSIYFHQLYGNMSERLYQNEDQMGGKAVHETIDTHRYSNHKNILQGISICSRKYGLSGKIDLFDIDKGILTERKKKITEVYDGYIFQLYAQYFCLTEEGFDIRKLRFYSYSDNKIYPIPLPEENPDMLKKFEKTIENLCEFDPNSFVQTNAKKCGRCIYSPLCDRSLADDE